MKLTVKGLRELLTDYDDDIEIIFMQDLFTDPALFHLA